MSVWNPALYLKNAGPRLKPALDLLNRTVVMFEGGATPMQAKNAQRVLDLGCGPGNITPFLKEVWQVICIINVLCVAVYVQRLCFLGIPFGISAGHRLKRGYDYSSERNGLKYIVILIASTLCDY